MSAPEGKTDVPREPGHFRFGPKADFALGRLGCRRRSHLAPSAFGTETFSSLNDLLPGLRKMRGMT